MPVRTKDKKNTDLFFWKGYHGTKNQAERDQYRRKYPSDSENDRTCPDALTDEPRLRYYR